MDYQELYSKYQDAIRLRELSQDKNFALLREIFVQRILSCISLSAGENVLSFLAGIKEVFDFVDQEVGKVDYYREELDRMFGEMK